LAVEALEDKVRYMYLGTVVGYLTLSQIAEGEWRWKWNAIRETWNGAYYVLPEA
jgi:hypothetical protein